MPSAGRKFLLAGRGGLNLTHSEPLARFLGRYEDPSGVIAGAVGGFPPDRLRLWSEGLGQALFAGSSGRVFPVGMKAAPLLRAWLRRLDGMGVSFAPRHRWLGWSGQALRFETAAGVMELRPDATVLALGGASWPRMGSDGAWVAHLRQRGVQVVTFRPSNCGVHVAWTPELLARAEGLPLKRIAIAAGGRRVTGEAVITRSGLEGGAVYALSAPIRAALDRDKAAILHIDLRPDLSLAELAQRVECARQGRSMSNHLRRAAGLAPGAASLVQMALHQGQGEGGLAALIKRLEVRVTGLPPIERAISSAGGIAMGELDGRLMLRRMPGVFAAGEMLDWDAPTGGYLLQACFSTGVAAGLGAASWLLLRDQPAEAIASA